MTKDYNPTAETAKRLVTRFGRQATLISLADTSSGQDWRGTSSPRDNPKETLTVNLTSISVGQAVSLGIATENEDYVQRSEIAFLVAPGKDEQSDLTRFEEILDQQVYWAVERWQLLRPKDVNILYYAFARR